MSMCRVFLVLLEEGVYYDQCTLLQNSMCRVFLVLLEEGVCYDQCILCKTLLAFALLHSLLQGQICLLLQVFLDFLFFIPVFCNEKDIFFGC